MSGSWFNGIPGVHYITIERQNTTKCTEEFIVLVASTLFTMGPHYEAVSGRIFTVFYVLLSLKLRLQKILYEIAHGKHEFRKVKLLEF